MSTSAPQLKTLNLKDIIEDANIPLLIKVLESLSPNDKFQLLSSADKGAFPLHDIMYSICDKKRSNIPGNDPDLINVCLSGLSGEQRIHLLRLTDYNDLNIFCIFTLMDGISADHYPTILRNLFAGLSPDEKFQVVMTEQERSGDPLDTAMAWYSAESIEVIREGLTIAQWEQILTSPHDNSHDRPIDVIYSKEIADALLKGFDSKSRTKLLTTCGQNGELALISGLEEGGPELATALLEGLDHDDMMQALKTPNKKGEFPLLNVAKIAEVNNYWDTLTAISAFLSDDEYTDLLGHYDRDFFPLPLLFSGKNGATIVRHLLERLDPDHICTLLSARNQSNFTMLEFLCKKGFKEEEINIFFEKLNSAQRLKVLTAPTLGKRSSVVNPTPLTAILMSKRDPAFLLKGLSEEERFQVVEFSQKKDGFLNRFIRDRKENLQNPKDENHTPDSLDRLLSAFSPNLRQRIFDLPDKNGITPRRLLDKDLAAIESNRVNIESIRKSFIASHDGATSPQSNIRAKLNAAGRANGRRLELC